VSIWQTVYSPSGVLTVERFARRKSMIVSAFGLGTYMAIIAGTSSSGTKDMRAVGTAGVFIFMYSLFFPVGFLGMAFLYASEIAPISARTHITAFSTGSAWLFSFLVAETSPTLHVLFRSSATKSDSTPTYALTL